MPAFPPTEEQSAIIDAVKARKNVIVQAYAGAAKTTTLEFCAHAIRGRAPMLMAFNKSIAVELAKRVPSQCQVKTFNGAGHTVLMQQKGNAFKLNANKLREMARDFGFSSDVVTLCAKAQNSGLVPTPLDSEWRQHDSSYWPSLLEGDEENPEKTIIEAEQLLIASIQSAHAGVCDFTDQIYYTCCFLPRYRRTGVLFIDEAQDLSPLNHRQISLMQPEQLVFVGDKHQAIYAWRGADSQSMERVAEWPRDWAHLSLRQSFRCPKVITARQREVGIPILSHESCQEGSVSFEWPELEPGLTVICRNNAPLFKLAVRTIDAGIPVQVLGSDLGPKLIKVIQRFPSRDKVSKAFELDPDNDQLESVLWLWKRNETPQDVITRLNEVFKDKKSRVLFTTGHRSKGHEWDKVMLYRPDLLKTFGQDVNLRYVIETRTKNSLSIVGDE